MPRQPRLQSHQPARLLVALLLLGVGTGGGVSGEEASEPGTVAPEAASPVSPAPGPSAVEPRGAETYVLPAAGSDAWQPLVFPRIERQTIYRTVERDGVKAVHARSECAASALVVSVDGLQLRRTPRLSWRWRVDEARTDLNPREKSGDDFPARVYVSFRFQPEKATRWERLKRGAAEQLYGAELPGNALNYVWSASEPAGARWPSPYTESSQMVSLGGKLGAWSRHQVDVEADYRKAFGEDPPPVLFVGVMSDTDNSCSEGSAYFADFRFSER